MKPLGRVIFMRRYCAGEHALVPGERAPSASWLYLTRRRQISRGNSLSTYKMEMIPTSRVCSENWKKGLWNSKPKSVIYPLFRKKERKINEKMSSELTLRFLRGKCLPCFPPTPSDGNPLVHWLPCAGWRPGTSLAHGIHQRSLR